jgi:para-aminobenzoate synthetase / 4-amino-4-deoxychorismate lyase
MSLDWLLLDDCSHQEGKAQIFANPCEIIIANSKDEIDTCLAKMARAQSDGFYLAGFVSYEFGLCFEEKTKNFADDNFPLLCFGVYEQPKITKSKYLGRYLQQKNRQKAFYLGAAQLNWDFLQYKNAFEIVHENIVNGHIYQANLTLRASFEIHGNSLCLYEELRRRQRVKYGAFMQMANYEILSLSPELFFKIKDGIIETHPMKGTLARNSNNDEIEINQLYNDTKQRAENLMITDLMRNDLSKIAGVGSVKVPQLFAIESLETLHQMISKINASLLDNITAIDVLRIISPAGSITGCPKIRAEEIINQTENSPRGIYCGAIGYIAPNNDACFNVAIRTALIKENKIELGIGSGVVYDSNAFDEYEECLLKSKFLGSLSQVPQLIETFGYCKNTGFNRLEAHLERMQKSARFFSLDFDFSAIKNAIFEYEKQIEFEQARMRIVYDGNLQITHGKLNQSPNIYKIKLSPTIMQSNNPWLYHKTTNRKLYDDEWAKYNAQGFDEVIYCNENGELTEGSRTNLFVDFGDGKLCTPPLKCGVLGGILRAETLANGQAKEQILYPQDLQNAKKIFVGNSLRGLIRAEFIFEENI